MVPNPLKPGIDLTTARIACERASFELSRDRMLEIMVDGSRFCVETVESLLLRGAGPTSSGAQLIIAEPRAGVLQLPHRRDVLMEVGGLSSNDVAALAGLQEMHTATACLCRTATVVPAAAIQSALLRLARDAGRLPAMMCFPASSVDAESFGLDAEILLTAMGNRPVKQDLRHLLTIRLPSRHGEDGCLTVWRDQSGRDWHAFETGVRRGGETTVRLHSECFTGDVLGSLRCDCERQLSGALDYISSAGSGVILYLPQEGRGIGLTAKLRTYLLQQQGADTYNANCMLGFQDEEREFATAAAILSDMGIDKVALLSNNPEKAAGLTAAGVHVERIIPLRFESDRHNDLYISAKRKREQIMGNKLQIAETMNPALA